MICIVTAIFSEAKALIETFELEKKQTRPFLLYGNQNIILIISGMGKINAAIATTYISQNGDIEKFINIGICGTNDKSKKIGDIYLIRSIIDKSTNKKYMINNLGEPLYCYDKIIKDDINLKKNILIDMESFGFYSAAVKFTKQENIKIYKIVSDYLDTKHISNDFIYKISKQATKEVKIS